MSFAGVMSHVPVIGALFGLFVKSPIDQIKDVLGDVSKYMKGGNVSPEEGLAKIAEICGDNKDLAPVAQVAKSAMAANSNPFDADPNAPEPEDALSQIAQMVGAEPQE